MCAPPSVRSALLTTLHAPALCGSALACRRWPGVRAPCVLTYYYYRVQCTVSRVIVSRCRCEKSSGRLRDATTTRWRVGRCAHTVLMSSVLLRYAEDAICPSCPTSQTPSTELLEVYASFMTLLSLVLASITFADKTSAIANRTREACGRYIRAACFQVRSRLSALVIAFAAAASAYRDAYQEAVACSVRVHLEMPGGQGGSRAKTLLSPPKASKSAPPIGLPPSAPAPPPPPPAPPPPRSDQPPPPSSLTSNRPISSAHVLEAIQKIHARRTQLVSDGSYSSSSAASSTQSSRSPSPVPPCDAASSSRAKATQLMPQKMYGDALKPAPNDLLPLASASVSAAKVPTAFSLVLRDISKSSASNVDQPRALTTAVKPDRIHQFKCERAASPHAVQREYWSPRASPVSTISTMLNHPMLRSTCQSSSESSCVTPDDDWNLSI